MGRRRLRTVAVTLLVLFAGCAGFTSGGESTPTGTVESTPTPTPQPTRTATQTEAQSFEGEYPRGWSETGIQNTTVALESHYRAVLSGPSTTVRYRSGVLAAKSDQAANTTLHMRIDTGEKRLHATINGTKYLREAFFTNGTFTEWSVQNETVVSRSDASFIRVAQSIDSRVLRSQLLLYRLQLTDTVTRGGTTAMVYNVTGVYNNTLSQTYGSATAGSGRVVVSERGRILEIRTTVTYTGGKVTYRYLQTGIGETDVNTPEWVHGT